MLLTFHHISWQASWYHKGYQQGTGQTPCHHRIGEWFWLGWPQYGGSAIAEDEPQRELFRLVMFFMFTGRADDKWNIYQHLFEPSQEIRLSKWVLSWKRALRTILKLCSTRWPDARWHQESPCQQDASVQVGSANWIHDGAHKLTWPPATLKILECSEWPWKLIMEEQPARISMFSYGIGNEQQRLRAE